MVDRSSSSRPRQDLKHSAGRFARQTEEAVGSSKLSGSSERGGAHSRTIASRQPSTAFCTAAVRAIERFKEGQTAEGKELQRGWGFLRSPHGDGRSSKPLYRFGASGRRRVTELGAAHINTTPSQINVRVVAGLNIPSNQTTSVLLLLLSFSKVAGGVAWTALFGSCGADIQRTFRFTSSKLRPPGTQGLL